MMEPLIVTVTEEPNGLYSVAFNGEKQPDWSNKPKILAEFLAEWARRADRACRMAIERRGLHPN